MTTFQRLKQEARKAEQRSDWRRAIALYREAMRFDDRQRGSSELGLFNRIGDLHIRLGEIPQAVECYELAADRYAENELPTSAIALCNKILRVAPDRVDVFRRLGLLHAATGLIVEARAAMLQFVDRMEKAGSLGEAIDAVQEYVDETGDESLRAEAADLFDQRGHTDQAIAQLRLAAEDGRRKGRDATALETRIEALSEQAAAPPVDAPTVQTPSEPDGPARDAEESRNEPASEIRLGERVQRAMADAAVSAGFDGAVRPARDRAPDFAPAPGPEPSAMTAEALERFRAAVQPELDRVGPELYYDLGVAFSAMRLDDAAVDAFRRGVGAPGRLHDAYARLGRLIGDSPLVDAGAGPERTIEATDLQVEPAVPQVVPAQAEPEPLDVPAEALEAETEPDDTGPAPGTVTVPESESPPEAEVPSAMPEEESLGPDLQGLMFRARLAQYQIRRAQDSGRTDHRSQLDLGVAYAGMGLRVEAVRELSVAMEGEGHVPARAVSVLLELCRDPDTPWELALSTLGVLGDAKGLDTVRPVLQELCDRWPEDHPGRSRVNDMLGWVATAAEPLTENGPTEVPPEPDTAADTPDPAGLAPVDGLLDRLTDVPPEPPPPVEPRDAAATIREAEELLADGREQEAVARLYRALEAYEDARQVREAAAVLDRLLELRPDDVVLHHQRAEFALTLDDTSMLVRAYLNLAECLHRQQATGNARTVYGRVLEIDPENEEAARALERLSTDACVRRQAAIDLDLPPPPTAVPAYGRAPDAPPGKGDPADFDLLLEDLKDPGPGDEALGGDAEAHFELGIAFKQMEMWDEALAELEQAVQGIEDPVPVWRAMAECQERAGRKDAALALLLEAETLSAEAGAPPVDLLYRIAVLLMEHGRTHEAETRLRQVTERDPSHRDAAARLSGLSR